VFNNVLADSLANADSWTGVNERELSTSSDPELMVAIAAGDEAAFVELVKRHQLAVYGTIVKMLGDRFEAEDLAQQAFVRVHRSAGSYRPTAQFRTWLFTIVRNLVFNEHRRRRRAWFQPLGTEADREGERAADFIAEPSDPQAKSPAHSLLDREMIRAIDHAILALPEQQRLAVILRRYDEFSYDEIAAILKTTAPATKSLLFRARETLRENLRHYLDE
jgi:RNA polymerase sigma-70 factor (ECF subfamily)